VVAADETVEIVLPENPTTGFVWNLDPASGLESSAEHRGGHGAIGEGGVRRFLVRPLEPGRHQVRLRLMRTWNQEVEKTLELELVVPEGPAETKGNR
jgi:predicted secreted protein